MIVDKDSAFPNSMSLPSHASFVVYAKSKEDVAEAVALAKREQLPILAMGDGTNLLPSTLTKAVVLILDNRGIKEEDNILTVQAGEKWDDVVKFAVERGLSGIEALSSIPGKAGAAPIQNIGAYGAEIGDTIEYVEVYDKEKEKFVLLDKEDCEFGYRDSLFKKNKSRFIVVAITLKLSKEPPKIPDYKDVKKYFKDRANTSPSLQEIREAIIEIRKNKLPDPSVVPNCGSFFKNPFVTLEKAKALQTEFPTLSVFPSGERVKIPAGFLIEQAGFKGQKIGNVEIYKNNALVITNPHGATFADIIEAKDTIQQSVLSKFGILLEPEVNIIE